MIIHRHPITMDTNVKHTHSHHARFAHVYLVDAPWWIEGVLTLFWPFVTAKLRQRVKHITHDKVDASYAMTHIDHAVGARAAGTDCDSGGSGRAARIQRNKDHEDPRVIGHEPVVHTYMQ